MSKKTNGDISRISGFIRLPSDEIDLTEAKANPLFCELLEVKTDDDPLAGIWISSAVSDFERDGNPVRAFESFVRSVEAGVYPPLSVVRWVGNALQQYLDGQGKKDLDECFGAACGRGQTPPYKQLLMQDRDDRLFFDMDMLMFLGANREEAAEMVSRKLEQADWNKTMWDIGDLTAETIGDRHKRAGRPDLDDETATLLGLNDQVRKSEFLNSFPYKARSIV